MVNNGKTLWKIQEIEKKIWYIELPIIKKKIFLQNSIFVIHL